MNAYVVVEGESDAALLRRILPQDLLAKVAVVASGGRSAAVSLSRSVLIARQAPTALVVDADTTQASAIEEQRVVLGDLLRSAAGKTPFLVELAVPEVEAMLFHETGLLERVTGQRLTDAERITAGFRPRDVLAAVLERAGPAWTLVGLPAAIEDKDVAALRASPLAEHLIRFLRGALPQEGPARRRITPARRSAPAGRDPG